MSVSNLPRLRGCPVSFILCTIKMEGVFFMEKTQVTLSVFHDGQFFTALFERRDAQGFSVARRLFGAKPSDNEILDLIVRGYGSLRFSRPAADNKTKLLAANPKRRQREAAKAARSVCTSTKAQAALKTHLEENKASAKAVLRKEKKRLANEKFAHKQNKRKEKHKGR